MKRTARRIAPRVRTVDPLGVAWRLLASSRTATLLLTLTALPVLAGAVLPQATQSIRADRVAYAAWIEERRGTLGQAVGPLDALSLFAVYSAWWFRLLLCTVALCCGVYVASRLEPRIRRMHLAAPSGHDPSMRAIARLPSPLRPEDVSSRIADGLRVAGYTTHITETADAVHIRAERNRRQRLASAAAHLGFVVLLAAAVVGHLIGWQELTLAVAEGSTVEIGHDTGLAIRNGGFTHTRYPGGKVPKDYRTEITLLKDGHPVRERYELRVNSPLAYEGVRIHQAFFGPAAGMRVASAEGQILLMGGIPLLYRDPENRPTGRARAGGYELEVLAPRTDRPDQAVPAGTVRVRVYRAGAESRVPLAEMDAPFGRPVSAAGLTLLYEGPRQYSGLHVTRNPAVGWVWGGAVLTLAGTLYVFAFPYRSARVVIYPVTDGSQITVRRLIGRPMGREQETARVITAVRTAITPDPTRTPNGHFVVARKG